VRSTAGSPGPAAAPNPALPTIDELVDRALAEDLGDGDRTTLWTVPAGATGEAHIVAKAAGVLAGADPASRVFRRLDPSLTVEWRVADGERVGPGDELARIEGSLAAILEGERAALNFLGHLSGIATLAAAYAATVEGTGCKVTDTRKTTPGWRGLEKAAAASGGALNHRLGLYDMVLIKENHATASGGIGAALRAARREAGREGIEVEVEVTNESELDEALAGGADRILLDNMTVPQLRAAVELVRAAPPPWPLLEASGGVTLANVRDIAETGVDLVSVGAITHSAPWFDVSLLVLE
jgi:nicotinate-nucleotide pyrophosphorylase (carboxylating)